MTPVERDEVRAVAADNARRRGHADACDCDRCRHDLAVLLYVPTGDAGRTTIGPMILLALLVAVAAPGVAAYWAYRMMIRNGDSK